MIDQSIKLIALDCDGTLINDEGEITERTAAALIKAQQQGVRVALVSGRPRTGFQYEVEKLLLKAHHGLLCAYNGGMIIDVQNDEVKYEKPIKVDEVRRFLAGIERHQLVYIIDNGETLYSNDITNQYVQHESTAHHLKLVHNPNLADNIDFTPLKILLTADKERINELYDEINEICGETLGSIKSAPFYLEITVKGVNKSSALDHICDSIGISKRNCMAFGDNYNDYEMIRDAGIGVAMGNAVESIKKVADIVTKSNNEDGIAEVLEQYGLT